MRYAAFRSPNFHIFTFRCLFFSLSFKMESCQPDWQVFHALPLDRDKQQYARTRIRNLIKGTRRSEHRQWHHCRHCSIQANKLPLQCFHIQSTFCLFTIVLTSRLCLVRILVLLLRCCAECCALSLSRLIPSSPLLSINLCERNKIQFGK